MKKIWTCLLVGTLLLTAAMPALGEQLLVGGWTPTEDATVPDEVAEALSKALDGLVGATWEPVALLGTQVVAGLNYCLLCRITPVVPDPLGQYALVYLYVGLQGEAEILGTSDLDLGAMMP